MDYITLDDTLVETIIGILPEELTTTQPLLVSVRIGCSLQKAGRTDRIEHTINYAEIESLILSIAKNHHFSLLERFAEEVVAQIFASSSLVEELTVRITKPTILKHTRQVSIEIIRSR